MRTLQELQNDIILAEKELSEIVIQTAARIAKPFAALMQMNGAYQVAVAMGDRANGFWIRLDENGVGFSAEFNVKDTDPPGTLVLVFNRTVRRWILRTDPREALDVLQRWEKLRDQQGLEYLKRVTDPDTEIFWTRSQARADEDERRGQEKQQP